jgi:flagellar basal-body rod modification protein FlgD
MSAVFPISSATQQSTSNTPAPTTGTNTLDSQAFLQLLVAELKYQDPMSPADPTQFLTQTAQFTQVQTLQAIQSSQQATQIASQVLAASSMIGHNVTYSLVQGSANGVTVPPTPTSLVQVRGTLPSDAKTGASFTASTSVYTTAGAKVPLDLKFTKTDSGWSMQPMSNGASIGPAQNVTFDAGGAISSGDIAIPASALANISGTAATDWPASGIVVGFGDASDPTRLQLSSSASTISVVEQNGNDGNTATGIVTGMHMTANGPTLVIGGQEIPYTSVIDVG